jgi:hypothetical protein
MAYAPIDAGPQQCPVMWQWSIPAPWRAVAQAGDEPGNDKPTDQQPKDDENRGPVITPGGPRPREQVHPVGPGEMVRRNPDGTYSVVPKPGHDDKPDDNKGKQPDE